MIFVSFSNVKGALYLTPSGDPSIHLLSTAPVFVFEDQKSHFGHLKTGTFESVQFCVSKIGTWENGLGRPFSH